MASFSPHALLSAGVVAGMLAACSARNDVPAPTARRAPAVTAEDIQRSPAMPIEQLIVMRVPGVTLTRAADGHVVIHVRGTTTVYGEKEPLVVLDGIPLQPTPSGNLGAIDPLDIATIEVVRDAAGAAMYGARGSNGVIVITTKRPPR